MGYGYIIPIEVYAVKGTHKKGRAITARQHCFGDGFRRCAPRERTAAGTFFLCENPAYACGVSVISRTFLL